MPEKINCPKCGKHTPEARFCKHCGEPLYSCLSCGARLSSDSKFCTECGVELPPEQIETAGGPKAYARYGPSQIPKDILIEGEEPLFETRPVLWMQLMPPVVFIVIGLGILISTYYHFHSRELLYGCGGLLLVGALWAFLAWMRWRYTIYAITNRRVIQQKGIISRTYVDCPLPSISNIHLDISLWGRINGFGTVHITGGNTQIKWEDIDTPREAHRLLNQFVDQHRRKMI